MDEKGTRRHWGCLPHARLQMARVSVCFKVGFGFRCVRTLFGVLICIYWGGLHSSYGNPSPYVDHGGGICCAAVFQQSQSIGGGNIRLP